MDRCEICHNEIYGHQGFVLCPADHTPYHKDCWDYNYGCGVLGCQHNPHTAGFVRVVPGSVVKAKQVSLPAHPFHRKSGAGWIIALFLCMFILAMCCCCSLTVFWFYGDALINQMGAVFFNMINILPIYLKG